MDRATNNPFRALIEVRQHAERLIGTEAWALVSCFGKLMDGPMAGAYVCGMAFNEQLALLQRLADGQTVPVHLMHKHRSGNYEASELRLSNGGELLMVFPDREERA